MSHRSSYYKEYQLSKEVIDDFLHIVPAVLYEYVLYEQGSGNEFLYLSPATEHILGFPPEYFLEDMNRFWEMVHPEDLERLQSEDRAANDEGEIFHTEVRLQLPSGKTVWIRISSRPTNKTVNDCAVWSGYMIDITKQKQLEDELQKLATIDSLTHAFNRRAFYEKLNEEVGRARRYQHPLSVVVCDLDDFKLVNDTFGHAVGDQTLNEFGALVTGSMRESDFIGRVGGEEFALALPYSDIGSAAQSAERLRSSLEQAEFVIDGNPVTLTISVGLSELRDEADTVSELMKRADDALYEAKTTGRNKVVIYRAK